MQRYIAVIVLCFILRIITFMTNVNTFENEICFVVI